MSHIRYKIHTISAQALIAYAKGYTADPDRYHYHLNKRETESTIIRQGETYQEDNAIFFQAMCAVKGDDYTHSATDSVLDDLSDVIFYVDFKGIFDRSDSNPRIATRQKKAESMFRPEGIFLDFGNGEAQYFAFERSASMSRNARLAFIRADVYGKVHSRMTLDMQIGDCQLSKLYAYNGLMFSSGTRIEAPNLWSNHSIVVIDNPKETVRGVNVITVEDATGEGNVRKYERVEAKSDIKVTLFDGEGLISKEFSEQIDKSLSKRHEHHSFQIRMPYIKGMVHEVDFRRLLTSVGITMIKDIWGNPHPVSEINLILTKSQLKGFGWLEESGYHWFKYIRVCEMYRHALYVTGISKADPEEVTELNYQFLNTVSMKAELFRPDDLPLGWNHSPDEEERNWLTKATEQRYYDLVANEDYGSIRLKDLIIAREHDDLETLISLSSPYLLDREKVADCIERIKSYAEDSLPVLNEKHALIGIITAQDVVEVVDDELGEDYAKLAGLTAEEDLKETTFASMRKRLPWLIVLLFLGIGVSSVVGVFEGVVATLPIIICFQSLILDMAGNVGTQSLAVTIRVLMDETVKGSQKVRLVLKEMKVGLCNGLFLGSLSFAFIGMYIWLFKHTPAADAFLISGCVGISLMAAMIISSSVGTVVPLFFHKIKVDPAVASGPLITTVNDLVAVVTYYGLAWILLIEVLHIA